MACSDPDARSRFLIVHRPAPKNYCVTVWIRAKSGPASPVLLIILGPRFRGEHDLAHLLVASARDELLGAPADLPHLMHDVPRDR